MILRQGQGKRLFYERSVLLRYMTGVKNGLLTQPVGQKNYLETAPGTGGPLLSWPALQGRKSSIFFYPSCWAFCCLASSLWILSKSWIYLPVFAFSWKSETKNTTRIQEKRLPWTGHRTSSMGMNYGVRFFQPASSCLPLKSRHPIANRILMSAASPCGITTWKHIIFEYLAIFRKNIHYILTWLY